MTVTAAILVIWAVLSALVLAGCVLGGRADDVTEQAVGEAS